MILTANGCLLINSYPFDALPRVSAKHASPGNPSVCAIVLFVWLDEFYFSRLNQNT